MTASRPGLSTSSLAGSLVGSPAGPLALCAALALVPRLAEAGPVSGFVEVSYGLAAPQGDGEYKAMYDGAAKLGLRQGVMIRPTRTPGEKMWVEIGLDIGGDHTDLSLRDDDDSGMSFSRWRLTAGPRLVLRTEHAVVSLRGGIGLDRITFDFDGRLCEDEQLDGLALEGQVGAGFAFGHFVIGPQFGISSGDHRDSQSVCSRFGQRGALDNRIVELDAQLMAGWHF